MIGDLIGKTINWVTVLDEYKKGKHTVCKVRCKCGKEFETHKQNIKSGDTKSCGCYARFKRKDITGKRFGRLVVLQYLKTENKTTIWLCRCDCGNITQVSTGVLISRTKQSCGCLVSETSKENVKKAFATTEKNMIDGTLITAIKDRKINKNNTSGIKGVWFDKSRNKWVAEIWFKRKKYSLGRYENIEDATKARKAAEEKYYKPMIESFEEKNRQGN